MSEELGYVIREAKLSLLILIERTEAQKREIESLKTQVKYLKIIIEFNEAP